MSDAVIDFQELPLFRGLSRIDLAKLLPEIEDARFAAGEILFREGDVGDALFVLRAGRVEVEAGGGIFGPVRLAELGAGDCLGELALLTGEPRNATVRALTAVDAWRLGKDRFEGLVAEHPELALALIRSLVARLTATDHELARAQEQLRLRAEEHLIELSPAAQEYALRAALLDPLDPAILGRLPGGEGGPAALTALAAVGLVRRDRGGAWRLTEDCRDYLLAQLDRREGAEGARRRRAELAAALEAAGAPAAACTLYLGAGAYAEAAALLNRHGAALATADPQRFVRWLEEVAAQGPPLDAALLELGAATAQTVGEGEAALRLYQRALADPAVAADSDRAGRIARRLAALYLERGDAARTMVYLQLAGEPGRGPYSLESGAPDYLRGTVSRLLRTGRPDEALRWARRALRERTRPQAPARLHGRLSPAAGRLLTGLLAVLVTLALWRVPPPQGFPPAGWHALALLSGGAILWLFNTLPDFVVGLAYLVLAILLGVSDRGTALSGFVSQTFLLTLGVLGLGAAMLQTGFLFRLVLHMLRRVPPTYFWQVLALALSGLLLTAAIPLVMGRIVLAAPLALTISDALRLGNRSKGSTGLAMATLLGFGLMSFPFFNNTGTLLIYGAFPPEAKEGVGFVSWLLWSLPVAAIFFGGSLAAILVLYRARAAGRIAPETIRDQLALLGPVTRAERLVIAIMLVALVVFIWQPFGVDPALIMLLLLCALIGGGVLDRSSLRGNIDWPMLLNQVGLLGIAAIAGASGLTDGLAHLLTPLLGPLSGNPYLFLGALLVGIYVSRIILPAGPVFLLLLVSLIPLAPAFGMHPFIFGTLVQVGVALWLLPQQSQIYLLVHSGTEERAFTHSQALPFTLALFIFTLLGILASIPLWQAEGLIK
jgi:CRP-like cAMP-binding protein/di/tricarboxylate transporter